VVSVLEGGYSSRALSSGAFAHLLGLTDVPADMVSEEWWSLENLIKLEKATKQSARRTSALASVSAGNEHRWIERTLALLTKLDVSPPSLSQSPKRGSGPTNVLVGPFERMTLRERKKVDPSSTGRQQSGVVSKKSKAKPQSKVGSEAGSRSTTTRQGSSNGKEPPETVGKRHEHEDWPPIVVKADPEGGNVGLNAKYEGDGFLETKKTKKVILHVKPPPQGTGG